MPNLNAKNPQVRQALRALGLLERDFRRHATLAVNRIIAIAFAEPNTKLREPAQDCLERLIVVGGAKLSKSGLSKLTDSLEALEAVLYPTDATPNKRDTSGVH